MDEHELFRAAPGFFRQAIESLTEYALVTTDRERRVSSWSRPAAAMFGWSEPEIVGRSISLLFTPEDREAGVDRSEFAQALKKGREDDERWHMRKDGTRLWCYGLSFPLKDEGGSVQGFVKLIRDDSERKRRDDLLRESEERLRLAAESTGLGTWDYDVAKGTLYLSPRASELFGLGRETKAPRFEQLVERVHAEDRDRITAAFERCLRPGGDCQAELEYRIGMPDGETRWARTLARAFFPKGAKTGAAPQRLLGTVVDVTDARRLNQQLEDRVRRRTAQLIALNKELESFAYSASHDLRAPLRKIAAFSQAILEGGQSALSDRDRDYFGRIRSATSRMHQLIDDTLELSRVARQPLARAKCDLSAMARRVAEELRAREPGRRVELVIAEGLKAEGDPELLAAALRNLLENAWKFTSRHPTARIEFGARTGEGGTVYFVKDDGAGFDMRYAHKLFGPFRRLHGEEEFPGTGVGLGVVERVVERHHGRIWAEAEVEKGAVFYFTLGTEPG